MGASLPISDLVKVSVNLSPSAAQSQNISTLLALGNSSIIDTVQRIRFYSSLAAVATDFGTSAPEYFSALLYFEQAPQPAQIAIGKWAQTATPGQLVCGEAPLTTIATWAGISAGAFKINIDGAGVTAITGLNFSSPAVTSMSGVAGVIQTALQSAFSDTATCTWDAVNGRFIFTGETTGTSGSVSFLTTNGSGTEIAADLDGLAADVTDGAYLVPGLAAESAASVAALFDSMFGQQWYALMMPTIVSDSDHEAVAALIEGLNNKHLYGVTTSEAGVLVGGNTSSIAYHLNQSEYDRSLVQYSSGSAYAVASLFGRILTVDYLANNSTITLMYKQEPGITAEYLNETQMQALLSVKCNVFVAYNNNTAIIQAGTVASGQFVDTITGTDWLALDIQTSVYNLLYLSQTKIPQTDAGSHQIATVIEGVCIQAVANGLLAPGVWTVGGFGNLNMGDFLPKGFYVYYPPIGTQNPSQRSARVSVPFQIAAKLAGAVQTVNIAISVNQ